ncbi:MAG: MIP family channel protein [Akkermansiaceae bacterium]|nr:MIP family channel protein [Akkermansiaceae bacterium]
MRSIPNWIIGEFIGTFILVFFGCGSVASAVTTGALVGVFQVAIVWGIGITTAIYLTAPLSGAHLNPAVTISMTVFGGFPKRRILPYIVVQMCGAFAAAAALYLIFAQPIAHYEMHTGISRGMPGSEASARVFGEFFPSPGDGGLTRQSHTFMGHASAFTAEVIGTAILLLVIFAVTDPNNKAMPRPLIPLTIGLTVTILICLLGPLTMACFNPARDLAPRIFSSVAGWGKIPFTANGIGWLTVYIIAPILGGLLGGFLYSFLLKPHYTPSSTTDHNGSAADIDGQ